MPCKYTAWNLKSLGYLPVKYYCGLAFDTVLFCRQVQTSLSHVLSNFRVQDHNRGFMFVRKFGSCLSDYMASCSGRQDPPASLFQDIRVRFFLPWSFTMVWWEFIKSSCYVRNCRLLKELFTFVHEVLPPSPPKNRNWCASWLYIDHHRSKILKSHILYLF
jgi:hypothetical protein